MIKHLPPNMTNALRYLANLCLREGDIPSEWKMAQVYPIPKPYDWEYDISKTRPITLLDTVRKLTVKVVIKQLSYILVEHHVLKDNNFTELPGESCEIPIKILNNILEDV